MKNMKKVLAVMTAVSAMAASTSAFAAEVSFVAEQPAETDSANILTFVPVDTASAVTSNYINIAMPGGVDNNEVTLLVLDDSISVDLEEHTVNGTITDDAILYIDQGTVSESVANPFAGKNLGLKVADIVAEAKAQFTAAYAEDNSLESDTYSYPVRLGYYSAGAFEIAEASIDITVKAVAEGGDVSTTIKIPSQWGEVDGNGVAEVLDAQAILTANVSDNDTFTTTLGDVTYTFTWKSSEVVGSDNKVYTMNYQWGEVDGNGVAEVLDAQAILTANVSDNDNFGTYDWKDSWTLDLTEKVGN